MVRSSAGVSRTSGFALALFCTTAVVEMLAVAVAGAWFDDVADASPFGRAGTIVVAAIASGIACVGTILAWRGSSGALRGITATLVFVVVGIVLLMVLYFLIAGGTPIILALWLAHAAFSLGMIGRVALQPAPTGPSN